MQFIIPVTVNITFDDGTADPAPGDPLAARMRDSARAALVDAIEVAGNSFGFTHDMAPIASVGFDEVGESSALVDAAPALLAALEALLAVTEEPALDELANRQETARAAIAKATKGKE